MCEDWGMEGGMVWGGGGGGELSILEHIPSMQLQ